MTREQAKELLPIIQAFAEGKNIQFLSDGEWHDHRLEKSVRITPSQAKELRKIVEMMSKPLPDIIKFTKQRLKL